MANFNTHVAVASVAASGAVSIAAYVGLIEAVDAPWYLFIGVVGGMLPDIDADNSKPVKRLFIFLAALISTAAWTVFAPILERRQLMFLAAAVFIVVRYPVFFLFQRTTVHRGVFHSLLGALFFGLSTTCISHYLLYWNVLQAWMSGVFLVFGFIVHLCLDEAFSVDLANGRMKKSFGTALKLFSYNDIPTSTILLAAVIALYVATPPSSRLIKAWERAEWAKIAVINRDAVNMLKRNGLELFAEIDKNSRPFQH